MTKFRLAHFCLCAAALVCGIVYLTVGAPSLPFVLPFFSLCFAAIAALQFAEVRTAGTRDMIAYIPVAATALVAILASTATLIFFATQ